MQVNWTEIRTLEEFREIRRREDGYLVITDTATPNKIHKPSCSFVNEENFEEKVIKNNCINGHYYWVGDFEFARRKGKASPCLICNPP